MEDKNDHLEFEISCLVLLAAITFRTVRASDTRSPKAGRKNSRHADTTKPYEDADGTSSLIATLLLESNTPAIPTILAAATTFLCGVANLGFSVVRPEQERWTAGWFLVIAWGLGFIQVFYTFADVTPTQRYNNGVWAGNSYIALLLASSVDAYHHVPFTADGVQTFAVFIAFTLTQIGMAIALFVFLLSIQRRPDVMIDGKVVDRQYTGSAFDRYTFGWVRDLLDHSRNKQRLEFADLPALDHRTRSYDTLRRFISMSTNSPVNESLWIEWMSFAHLAIPIRGQLSALIFHKSLRMKNLKGTSKASSVSEKEKEENQQREGSSSSDDEHSFEMESLLPESNPESESLNRGKKDLVKPKENQSNASQGVVNLLGVDAQRVADFTGLNYLVPGALIKVLLAIGFLIRLTGWWSVLAGLVVPIVFVPFNSLSTRKYAYYQGTVMKARDVKAKVVTEALHGIRQIKFSATEFQWQNLIMKAREAELKELWASFIWACLMLFCWFAMPIVLGGVVLGLHAWINGGMLPSVAFTALAIFGKLEWCLSVVPLTITDFYDAKVSIERIDLHLQGAESGKTTESGDSISFQDASVRWPSEDNDDSLFTMRNLNLDFPDGELSVICGKTGSGKGLLLAAILGEADVIAGKVLVPDSNSHGAQFNEANLHSWIIPSTIAYVAQIPWIENATIKENILFGAPFDEDRFRKTIHACALLPDLKILPDGDATEIGAKGINLSGGQRWRVTFARALYSRAETLILDDIFSAVDAHVGRHILEQGLIGELAQGRTRILATHHVGLVLPFATYRVFLGDGGTVIQSGLAREEEILRAPRTTNNIMDSDVSKDGMESIVLTTDTTDPQSPEVSNTKKFVEDEKRERGRITWNTYKSYIDASGGLSFWFWTFAFFVLLPASIFGRSWLIKVWTESSKEDANENLFFYLTLYLTMSVFSALIVSVKVILVCIGAIRASRKLFEDVTHAILRAPLRWLDTVPSGRILNRVIGDFAMVDAKFPSDLIYSVTSFLSLLAVIIAAIIVSPLMLIPFIILGLICIYSAILFLHGARELKRLESSSKSPIFDLYSSVLDGLDTIRSFDKTGEYANRMHTRIDTFGQSSWYLWLATRWLSFRMGVIGTIFTLSVAVIIIRSNSINASLAGLALSYALEYSATIVQTIRRYTGVEIDMNCTERIVEYANMPIESKAGLKVYENWPQSGQITVRDLEVGYANDLPAVLKGLNFSVAPGKRVGIVGRTGSGKSSLALSIFRFLEARRGSIIIDGQDISNLRLHDLRSRISIIPQDPVLFSGTVRSNLDIFERYSNDILESALKRVHLVEDEILLSTKLENGSARQHTNTPLGLETPISEGGLNLSQGQRQLLCLARAIVTQPKILVLDEATSAVDMGTDELIQRSIRESFSDCTMLVIAHRLRTVTDFDSVLVMENGRAVEYDSPKNLLRLQGAFHSMLQESGEFAELCTLIENAV
ncbi:ABC bile acid [Phlyctema vagabunda]|uniref:ABC bile acid n=1 Tax=Phlyctema vagabunda TaxID=108571 RepID=A0ABR4PCG7_9HELO